MSIPLPAQAQRLQKIIADRGLASRREAEGWIEAGRVKVNGRVANLGDKADPALDEIRVGRRVIPATPPRPTVLMMNKPKGWVCTNADPHADKTVFDLLPTDLQKKKLVCAGRLDKDSEGLLILSNDGDLVQALTHPSSGVVKRYRVKLSKPLPEDLIPKLLEGKKIEGDHLRFEKVIPAPASRADAAQHCEVHLHHGKKREIRRLFEAFGIYVKKLRRIQIGGLVLKRLGPGMFKELNEREIRLLFK
jgi:23S rRNA pseudouridine2605 synthase